MPSYIVKPGDTFETISRTVFGEEQSASIIAAGNPGVEEPLTAGTKVFFPAKRPQLFPQGVIEASNKANIEIDGQQVENFESIRITRLFDGIDSIEFTAPFDPNNINQRDLFQPFRYRRVTVSLGVVPLFRGTLISTRPSTTPVKRTITITAYSLPGVLHDCTMPASAYPLEFNDLKLDEIARKLCEPFLINVVFEEDDPGALFKRVAIEPGQKIFQFLAELAKQRNFIVGTSAAGGLVFKRSIDIELSAEGLASAAASVVAILTDDSPPVKSVRSTFNQQQYFSHITGIEPVVIGLGGSQITVQNTNLFDALRPFTFTITDTDGADVKTVVEAKMGRMFGDMAAYTLDVLDWRDSAGRLWTPNTILILTAPGAMIYKPSIFIIREVSLFKTGSQEEASLKLVLPGSYSANPPGVLPWD